MTASPDIKTLVREVLDNGYLLSLAVADEGGPWACDVIYVHDHDLNIYWLSSPQVRHSQAITKDNRVAGAITISSQGELNAGIQFHGLAEKLEDSRPDLVAKHFAKRQKPLPEDAGSFLHNHSWYVVKPVMIELIHEQYFGFKKQKFEC